MRSGTLPAEVNFDLMILSKASEQRSYLRWEQPMMGMSGEGQVKPLAPGCQPLSSGVVFLRRVRRRMRTKTSTT